MKTPARISASLSTFAFSCVAYADTALAAVFDGPGISGGLDAAGGINGLPDGDVRSTIVRILRAVLSFLALAAVITIIIAGIILILSLGNEEQKERAKRIIFYTLIGLVVILFARVIVGIVTVFLASQVA